MKIEALNSDKRVLDEIGTRIARTRLERNISQEQLAAEAGVSKSTVERLEAGREVRMASFVRVLRALGLLERIEALLPEPLPSPVERVKLHGRQRRRAGGTRRRRAEDEPGGWTWGTEAVTGDGG